MPNTVYALSVTTASSKPTAMAFLVTKAVPVLISWRNDLWSAHGVKQDGQVHDEEDDDREGT